MSISNKPLVWLHGEVRTPPFSAEARIEAGYLLRLLQKGEKLSMPHSRQMQSIGTRCHELRIVDKDKFGGSYIVLTKMPFWFWKFFKSKVRKLPNMSSINVRAELSNMKI